MYIYMHSFMIVYNMHSTTYYMNNKIFKIFNLISITRILKLKKLKFSNFFIKVFKQK